MGCRAAPPRASRGRSAPSARRDGRAAAPLHAARHRGGASGARVDSAGSGWGRVDRGCSLTAHTDPGRKPGVNGHWLIPGLAPGVSRVTDGSPHRRAVLALSLFAPRRARDHRDRPADHHDGRELRMARRGAPTRPAGGSDGRGRLERERRLSPRGHALGRTRTEDPCPAHRGRAALPGALTAGWNRGPAAGAPRPRAAAHSAGPARGGRRRAGAADPRDRSGIVLPTPWTQVSGMAFSVWDEVAFGPANLGWPAHEISRQVDRALERLELVPLASRDPATLSGGELQRVIIAAILAMDPGLVLFDEPAAELDAEGARTLWRLIRVLAKEGKGILLATSALDALPEVADRVVWLEQGAVRAVGTPDLLAEAALCDAGLGTSVATVWRDSELPQPAPLTIFHPVKRWGGFPPPAPKGG